MNEKIIYTRIHAVLNALGISGRNFSISIGKSDGYVTSLKYAKQDSIPSAVLSKILELYPAVNKDYILTGNGEPLRADIDTLTEFSESYEPQPGDYRELCMAYRKDLADLREEAHRLREAYLQLMENHNKLMQNYSELQAACLKTGINPMDRDTFETKKAQIASK